MNLKFYIRLVRWSKMINFKKNSIFSCDAKEESVKEDPFMAVFLSNLGSPGSGKTTTAVKLAKYLADRKKMSF